MKKTSLLKTMLLLCALIVGSSSAWAEEVTIATGTFAKTTYTSGWTCTGTGTGTTGCIIIGYDEYISSPALDLSGYSKITISITARRYGSLSGSKATIDASISGKSYGTTDATSTSVIARDDIEFEPTSSMTAAVLVFTCTNATSAGSSHGAGIGSITIKGTMPETAPSATVSTSSLAFGDVKIGTTKDLTFTVTPANLTGNLTIASNNGKYTVSPTSIAQATTTAQTITVTAAPTTLADDMDGTITISGGGLTSSKTVTLTATPYQEANVTLVAEGNLGTFEKDGVAITSLKPHVGSKAKIKAVANSGYEFISWSAVGATPASSSDAETEFTFTSTEVTLTASFGVKLSSDYVKVTDANTLRAGDQLILVYEDGNIAMGAIHTDGKYYTGVDVEINENIISDPTDVAVLTLGGVEDAWTFKSSLSSQYLSLPNNSNELRAAASVGNQEAEEWTISINGGDVYIINNKNPQNNDKDRYIQWNSGSPRFACYTGTQKDIQLYRLSKSVTITSAEYAIYCGNKALNFDGVGIKAYTATDNGDKVKLNKIENGQVPANTPVVLYKEDADGTAINVPVIASAAAVGDNDLHVSDGTAANDNMYVLANKSNGVGFYLWDNSNSNAIPEGKIYLQATSTARSFLGFEEGNTTSIDVRSKMEDVRGEVYNLNGQRVAQPTKGLYIVNGKKVVVK